jgi:hypothetical protein
MTLHGDWLAAFFLLGACVPNEPSLPPETAGDPVFEAALKDPFFRRRLKDPDFREAMKDPRVRREVRSSYSDRVYPLPTAAVIDRLERRLEQEPCIGSLDRWYRRYTNGGDEERGGIDPSKIEFSLHEAGKFEFESGREIVKGLEFPLLDHRAYKYASGVYDISTDKLTLELCGPNTQP